MRKAWFEALDENSWFAKNHVKPEQVSFITRALRLKRGANVLDAPCGDGQLAWQLAKRGLAVTGIDRVDNFTGCAKRRFFRDGLEGTFVTSDLRQIEFKDHFHAICCWNNSFGYFGEDENLSLLKKFANSLRSNGRILIDQQNREFILRYRMDNPLYETDTKIWTGEWNSSSQRLEAVWKEKISGREILSSFSSVRLYTRGQLAELFDQSGLQLDSVFGSKEGGPYRRNGERLVVAGRKKQVRQML